LTDIKSFALEICFFAKTLFKENTPMVLNP
jgi:hypothetical protein